MTGHATTSTAVAAALLLALCACSAAPAPPPPPPSPEEVRQILRQSVDFASESRPLEVRRFSDYVLYVAARERAGRFSESQPLQQVRTDAQLDYLREYFAHVLYPCLRSRGFTPPPLPDRELFRLDARRFTLADPLQRLEPAPDDLALDALRTACPLLPPGL